MSAKVKFCNAAKILSTICGGWWSAMSGAVSIPFAFFALFSDASHPAEQKLNFAIVAIAALWVFAIGLVLKNIPQFKLVCSKDIPLCATPQNAHDFRYFRMLVTTGCVNGIEQCSGNLEKIEKDGVVVFHGDATELPFAKPETRTDVPILLKPNIDYFLDVLVASIYRISRTEYELFCANPSLVFDKPDKVLIATKHPYTPANDTRGVYVFDRPGEYILHISVSGKGVPTAKAQLKFTWTGKANTSTIERIK